MKKSIAFALYEDRWCSKCIRRSKCEKTKLDIVLCSHNSYFKGPGQEGALRKDPHDILQDIEETKPVCPADSNPGDETPLLKKLSDGIEAIVISEKIKVEKKMRNQIYRRMCFSGIEVKDNKGRELVEEEMSVEFLIMFLIEKIKRKEI